MRPRDIESLGYSPTHLQRLYEAGCIQRAGRGLYMPLEGLPDSHSCLAEAVVRAPRGVVCLVSALDFHGLTTQLPDRVWLAFPPKCRHPRADWPAIRSVTMCDESFARGVEMHRIDGIPVPVFSPAKTVVDCFRFRNKIGVDVAVEALRDVLAGRIASVDEIWTLASSVRGGRILKPYLEALG